MKYFQIFRNRYERELPSRYIGRDTFSAKDYPEIEDHLWLLNHMYESARDGKPVDEEAVEAAKERLKKISPSSPMWSHDPAGPDYS